LSVHSITGGSETGRVTNVIGMLLWPTDGDHAARYGTHRLALPQHLPMTDQLATACSGNST
jgi:hypothetical protein